MPQSLLLPIVSTQTKAGVIIVLCYFVRDTEVFPSPYDSNKSGNFCSKGLSSKRGKKRYKHIQQLKLYDLISVDICNPWTRIPLPFYISESKKLTYLLPQLKLALSLELRFNPGLSLCPPAQQSSITKQKVNFIYIYIYIYTHTHRGMYVFLSKLNTQFKETQLK